MEKQFVVIGLLLVIGIVTVIFGKVIGPKLLELIAPNFNKATNKLDDAIMGKPDVWEAKVRQIVETRPEQLKQQVADIFLQFAKSAPSRSQPSVATLPTSAKAFFENYNQLSFDGNTQILDATSLQMVTYKKRSYLIIGRSADEGHFFAIDLHDGKSVVLLETDNGRVFNVEEDAPSFEHFVVLQHELHLKTT